MTDDSPFTVDRREPVIPRGKVIRPQQWKYTRQCVHLHVSGRRCGNRVPKDRRFCLSHADVGASQLIDDCRECKGMMEAFKPRKGWKR